MNELAYSISQLAKLTPQIYDVKYRRILYSEIVPTDFTATEWATSVETHFMDSRTVGAFMGESADDMPVADISMGRNSMPVRHAGIGFEWSLDEARIAQRNRIDLKAAKGRAAVRGYDEHAQRVAFLGSPAHGLEGYLNGAEVPVAANTFGGTIAASIAADPQTALTAVNDYLTNVWETTQTIHLPDTLLLPPAAYAAMTTAQISPLREATVMSYLRQHNVFTDQTNTPLRVQPLSELETAGAGGTSRMMLVSTNPDVATFHVPMRHRFIAPQMHGLKILVPGEYKLSGVEWRFPLAGVYVDGV